MTADRMDLGRCLGWIRGLPGGEGLVRSYIKAVIDHGLVAAPERWYVHAATVFDPLLPPGMHALTRRDLRRIVVTAFPCSTTRRPLWDAAERFLDQLAHLEVAYQVWLAGSFLTRKPDPADVDAVVVLRLEKALTLRPERTVQLEDVLDDAKTWRLDVSLAFECDLPVRAYLQGLLGFDENRTRPRGIAVLPMAGDSSS